MKESQPLDSPVEQVIEKQVKKTTKHLGTLRKVQGLSLYSLDLTTGHIEKVIYKNIRVTFSQPSISYVPDSENIRIRAEAEAKPNLIYVQALNIKNAKRKFTKVLKGK